MKFKLLMNTEIGIFNQWKFQVKNHKSQSFILLINVKMPTIVDILTFLSRINFMLSLVENEKSVSCITSGSDFK